MIENISLRAGDILVACDNVIGIPSGYIGHSAIAVNERYLVEAVMTFPHIRVVPISAFSGPNKFALYRPLDPAVGEAAARFAIWYHQQSENFRHMGIVRPRFSYSMRVPLSDPWTAVYCSKLVWLSYAYGAGMPFMNDFFLFSPEDIDTLLSRDPRFVVVYKHPEFQFVLDT